MTKHVAARRYEEVIDPELDLFTGDHHVSQTTCQNARRELVRPGMSEMRFAVGGQPHDRRLAETFELRDDRLGKILKTVAVRGPAAVNPARMSGDSYHGNEGSRHKEEKSRSQRETLAAEHSECCDRNRQNEAG
jgi:hypothetical protein